jgi:hypothetical protein
MNSNNFCKIKNFPLSTRRPWVTPAQEAEIRRIVGQSRMGKILKSPCLEDTQHKKSLVEWLKQ